MAKKKHQPKPLKKSTLATGDVAGLTTPEESTMLQLKMLLTLKNDFKAYAAKSPYKNMSELFEACFYEYKENHPQS
jgi:hypothetical protein